MIDEKMFLLYQYRCHLFTIILLLITAVVVCDEDINGMIDPLVFKVVSKPVLEGPPLDADPSFLHRECFLAKSQNFEVERPIRIHGMMFGGLVETEENGMRYKICFDTSNLLEEGNNNQNLL
jgi:hypothetical protein